MLYLLLILWLLFGLAGYLMMRQGSLVEFEHSLGKDRAWDKLDIGINITTILSGPINCFFVFLIFGKSCFKKRSK